MWKSIRCKSLAVATVLGSIGLTGCVQMPSSRVSPLNQLGRSWGFGISDGYHECPDCPKAGWLDEKLSALDSVEPFQGTMHANSCVVTPASAGPFHRSRMQNGADYGNSMLYQHYVYPADSCGPPTNSNSYQWSPPATAPIPATPMPMVPNPVPLPVPDPGFTDPNFNSPKPSTAAPAFPQSPVVPPSRPVPDPPEATERLNNPTPEVVPPAPPLRTRQPGDKPLGEIPENWAKPPVEETPKAESDDLDLLSDGDSQPFTYSPVRQNVPPHDPWSNMQAPAGTRSLIGPPTRSYPQVISNPYVNSSIAQGYSLPSRNRYR